MKHCHLELKPGVRLHGLVPQMVLAVEAVRELWEELDAEILTVTVGIEGQHTDKPFPSGHYRGDALDFRTKALWRDALGKSTVVDRSARLLTNVREELRRRLGPDFYIEVEDLGSDNEHLHVEWRPATRY